MRASPSAAAVAKGLLPQEVEVPASPKLGTGNDRVPWRLPVLLPGDSKRTSGGSRGSSCGSSASRTSQSGGRKDGALNQSVAVSQPSSMPPMMPHVNEGPQFASASNGARASTPTTTRRQSFDVVTSTVRGTRNGEAAALTAAIAALRDENQELREELDRQRMAASVPMHPARRPMAAIAGGGFRGPVTQKQCMCETLKAKLARVRSEMAVLREMNTVSEPLPEPPQFETREPPRKEPCKDAASQTAEPRTLAEASVQAERRPLEREVAAQVGGAACLADASTQVVVPLTSTASVQSTEPATASPPPVQELRRPELRHSGTQAGCGCLGVDAGTQAGGKHGAPSPPLSPPAPPARPKLIEVSVQVGYVAKVSDAVTQASQEAVKSQDAAVQVQVEQPRPETMARAMQTTEQPRTKTFSVASQTPSPPQRLPAATQATPPPGVDCSVQAVDKEALARETALAARLSCAEATTKTLEQRNAQLEADLRHAREMVQTWQDAAQSRALGQMHISILCPRAECTVNGDKMVMDGWNPSKLRAEFEREVLPRFTRLFIEEQSHGGGQKKAGRPEAIEEAMKEFAEVFRGRLSAMLSASTAAEAISAASGRARK